jgi:predicted GH43/DUF377 family glycosyl hydrolase
MKKTIRKLAFVSYRNVVRLIFPLFILTCLAWVWNYEKKFNKMQKENKSYRRYFTKAKIDKGLLEALPFLRGITLPFDLRNVPFGEQSGIVLQSKKISIRNVQAPYNASLIKNGDKYLLFFRYDLINNFSVDAFHSYIGCVELDKNFEQTEKEFKTIDTQSDYAEDPRVIQAGGDTYLVYNDFEERKYYCRTMRIAKINLDTLKLEYSTNLDLQMTPVEKNWPPFEYVENDGKSKIYFEYNIVPHQIFKLSDPKRDDLTHLKFANTPAFEDIFWPQIWGKPKGGTPCQKIDGQYLSFFHSCFMDKDDVMWYVMAAYTFEDKPPFRITSVSNYPLLFDGIYDSPIMNTAMGWKRIVFPGGFVMENADDRELIHLAMGENDSSVKIVTLDKKALLKSLKKTN